jgi:hypothetical protein
LWLGVPELRWTARGYCGRWLAKWVAICSGKLCQGSFSCSQRSRAEACCLCMHCVCSTRHPAVRLRVSQWILCAGGRGGYPVAAELCSTLGWLHCGLKGCLCELVFSCFFCAMLRGVLDGGGLEEYLWKYGVWRKEGEEGGGANAANRCLPRFSASFVTTMPCPMQSTRTPTLPCAASWCVRR